MSRKYFGTDGIRGHVGQFPITPDFMLKLGWAAGMAFRKQGKCRILVGKDAEKIDRMVREAPERAYDADFFQTLAKEVGWKLGAN